MIHTRPRDSEEGGLLLVWKVHLGLAFLIIGQMVFVICRRKAVLSLVGNQSLLDQPPSSKLTTKLNMSSHYILMISLLR